MNVDSIALATQTLGPIIGATSDLLARVFAGAIGLSQAKAELKGILATAAERLDAYDEIFAARDATETQRLKKP